jgi:hypothetical protein
MQRVLQHLKNGSGRILAASSLKIPSVGIYACVLLRVEKENKHEV